MAQTTDVTHEASSAAASNSFLLLSLVLSKMVFTSLELDAVASAASLAGSSSFSLAGDFNMAGKPWESKEISETCSFKVLAFLQAFSSSFFAGLFLRGELLDVVELPEAFSQAFKDSNSSIACLSVPVACLKHCLNFSGSLPSLLQWANKHTNWLASFPAQRSSFHSLLLWLFPYLRRASLSCPV